MQAIGEEEADDTGGSSFARRWVARALGSGSAAGFGAWVSYARSAYEGTVAIAPYEADLDSLLVGFDWQLASGGSLGFAAIVERRETETRYNGGGEEGDGFGLATFGVHPLSDRGSIDWTVGYTGTSTDQGRIDPADGSALMADFDSERWFAETNIVGFRKLGSPWLTAVRLSLIDASEDFDGYTEAGTERAHRAGASRWSGCRRPWPANWPTPSRRSNPAPTSAIATISTATMAPRPVVCPARSATRNPMTRAKAKPASACAGSDAA